MIWWDGLDFHLACDKTAMYCMISTVQITEGSNNVRFLIVQISPALMKISPFYFRVGFLGRGKHRAARRDPSLVLA